MATKVEELLQEISDVLEDTANSLDPSRHRDFIGLDDVLEQLISAARKEGAQRERERIHTLSIGVAAGEDMRQGYLVRGEADSRGNLYSVSATEDCYIVPASVLAPDKEGEK